MPSVNKDFQVRNGLVVNTNLIFASGGQVGINTTTPDANLTVVGTANVRGDLVVTGNVTVLGTFNYTYNSLSAFRISTGNSTTNVVVSNTDIRIGNSSVNSALTSSALVVGGASITASLFTYSTGNVGIGQVTAPSRLTVNGQIEMTSTGLGLKFPDGTLQNTAYSPTTTTPAAGSNTQIQFNTGTNAFGASAGLTWNGSALFANGAVVSNGAFESQQNGSATLPVFTFVAESNTGFFRSAAQEVSLTIGGTTRWTYQAAQSILNGNLLVNGTTNANGNLGVVGNATIGGTLAVGGVATFGTVGITTGLFLANNTIDSPRLKAWSETSNFFGNANGTVTLNLANTNVFRIEEVANVTLVFQNPPANNVSYGAILHVTHKSPGGQQTTWPASVKDDGGLPPPETTTSGAVDIWSIWTIDGGATYVRSLVHKDVH